jgi:hypothetical protein
MTFVNERISEEDALKFGLADIDKKFFVGATNARDWTIDRERNMYLRNVTNGREEYRSRSGWTFYCHGEWIYLELTAIEGGGKRGEPGWAHWKLQSIELPEHLKSQRTQILANLKEALIAYKDGGVFAMCTDYTVTLDI